MEVDVAVAAAVVVAVKAHLQKKRQKVSRKETRSRQDCLNSFPFFLIKLTYVRKSSIQVRASSKRS